MRTFASAFTLPSGGNWWNNSATLGTKSKWNTKLTSEGVIVDARNTAHIQELLNAGDKKLNYTVNNEIRSVLIPGKAVNNASVFMESIKSSVSENENDPKFEDAFHFSSPVLASFNQYKFVFAHQLEDLFSKNVMLSGNKEGEVSDADINNENVKKYAVAETVSWQTVPSLFNPYMAIDVAGISHNIPIYNNVESYAPLTSRIDNVNMDEVVNGKSETQASQVEQHFQTDIASETNPDFTDCSIKTLVRLSNNIDPVTQAPKELGQERFKYADFMFCKDVGRISNNYLITLRRFAAPIGDDISCRHQNNSVPPDLGRMLCYIGEDNKLEDILKYQYNATWKELNAKIDEKQSEEDDAARGIIGSIVNLASPQYLKAVASGTAGSGNKILGKVANSTILGQVFDNKGTYEHSPALGNYDQNIVYEPKDTIQDTHIYEGKLKFSQEFTLTFNYELRAYDNINPRTAFLDLLANIHVVTFRHGTFWAGEQKYLGVSQNKEGWAKANAFIDRAWDKLGGFCEALLTGNVDWQSVWGSISSSFGKAAQAASNFVDNAASKNPGKSTAAAVATEAGKKAVNGWKKSGMSDVFKGMLKNRLGRPALYTFSSLLPGGPTGFHHVTIGNPRAPIMSMGNLIITNTTVQHYGPLGIDDFPTGLKVTVTLKHAKSRDATNIQHMYTGGRGILAGGFSGIRSIEKYYNIGMTGTTDKLYSASNGADTLQMKFENGQWVMYEIKPDDKGNEHAKKLGTYSDQNAQKAFNNELSKRNARVTAYNEELDEQEDEETQRMSFWTSAEEQHSTHYGLMSDTTGSYRTVVERFGTNNIDQIVANAALYARKT